MHDSSASNSSWLFSMGQGQANLMGQRLTEQMLQQGVNVTTQSEANPMQNYATWHWWAEQQEKCKQAEPRSRTHIQRRANGLSDQKLFRKDTGHDELTSLDFEKGFCHGEQNFTVPHQNASRI